MRWRMLLMLMRCCAGMRRNDCGYNERLGREGMLLATIEALESGGVGEVLLELLGVAARHTSRLVPLRVARERVWLTAGCWGQPQTRSRHVRSETTSRLALAQVGRARE